MDEKLKTEIEQMTKELVTRCICRYQQEISKLAECEGFECDNLIRQAHCEPHIMYKLRNADGSLSIVKDGREYVFLVEFDPDDFAYGIYFGCRCTLNEGSDIARQVHICNKEWESIRSEVISNLNNTFVDMDFAKRDLPTDNVSNGTYWPFWFRLGDDEGVIEIAALATRIIRNTYRWFFEEANYQRLMSGCSLPKLKCGRKKDATIRTRYTQTQYDSIVECLKNGKKYRENADVYFESLLRVLEEEQIIEPYSIYEKCWKLNWSQLDFALLFCCFYKEIAIKPVKMQKEFKIVVEWGLVTPLILSSNLGNIDNIRKEFSEKFPSGKEDININTIKSNYAKDGIVDKIKDVMGELFPENK